MKTNKSAAIKSNGKKRLGRPPATTRRVQPMFRLSERVLKFLNNVTKLSGGLSSGVVAEACLWAHLPKEKAMYEARLKLVGRGKR